MTDSSEDQAPPARAGILKNLMRMMGRERRPDLLMLAEALLSERGEASGVALAGEVLGGYAQLAPGERKSFLQALARRFGADRNRLERAISRYRDDPSPQNGIALHAAAEPRRQELIRRLNLAPGAIERLVRMREDVLSQMESAPELMTVDADFQHLFSSWFNRGFLVLERVDWHTPALVLEKIIRYEAVHEITSWEDLRRRLDPEDRRCFAFFHPTLAGEPLIFVEVALVNEVPAAIAPLLAADRKTIAAGRATTAVFYSISNCQVGLRGVPLGNFLIKQVVEELKRELHSLKNFVTLSPVPGFAQWLRRERDAKGSAILPAEDKEALKAMDIAGWHENAQIARRLRPVLTAAVAEYFLRARNNAGKIIDPVARFHLNNGARLERVNWLGDVSAKGIEQGAGFMVNYLYDPGQIEQNHETFANDGAVVASRAVRRLLRTGGNTEA
jgi:malonyl-CoA decarboxylase